MADWLLAGDVKTAGGIPATSTTDAAALELARAAAQAYVEDVRPDLLVPGDPLAEPPTEDTYVPTPQVKLGAAMLAFRWYSRRGSPLGVIGFAELGTQGIMRHDPDVARLLGIGDHGRFVFGAPTPVVVEESTT